MKGYKKYFKVFAMLLMCLPLFGCNIYESNEKKSLRISNSIVNYISSNDYNGFTLLFSEEAREYLHSSIEDYSFKQVIFGKKLHICHSKIYGDLKQLGINKYESFDVECLINDDDNNYYLIFYSYCKSNNNDDKSIGVKKIIIVNSDKNRRGDLPHMTKPKNKYFALLAKVAIAGLSRVWDFIQDVLLEWMLPPIERVVSRLVAYVKKHLPAKRPKRKRKKIKPFLKEKLVKLLPPVRRVALVAAAVLVLLWNGWSLITTAATHISLSHDEVTAQPIVSDSSNSLQCSIKPIENRTSNMVVKNSGSNDFEHVEAVSSTGKKQTPIPAVYCRCYDFLT